MKASGEVTTRRRTLVKTVIVLVLIPVVVYALNDLIRLAFEGYRNRQQVTAAVEGPFAVLQINQLFKDAKIPINIEVRVSPSGRAITSAEISRVANDLEIYRVSVKNTGSLPVRDVAIKLVFEKPDPKFSLFAIAHKTTPAQEFGEIKEESGSDPFSRRFTYPLLNTDNEDLITILTNAKGDLKVYSKAAGVTFNSVANHQPTGATPIEKFFIGFASVLGGFYAARIMSRAKPWLLHKKAPVE